MRQPLGAIQAGLAVMRTRPGREKGDRARSVVERQVQQLTRMVEDLLDVGRIAQGKVTLKRERTDVTEGQFVQLVPGRRITQSVEAPIVKCRASRFTGRYQGGSCSP
jgi:K+-sensing histidine kinase KdpD